MVDLETSINTANVQIKKSLGFLDNKIVLYIIGIILIIYIMFIANVGANNLSWINNPIVKLIAALIIIFVFIKNQVIGVLLILCFVVTMVAANMGSTKQGFSGDISGLDTLGGFIMEPPGPNQPSDQNQPQDQNQPAYQNQPQVQPQNMEAEEGCNVPPLPAGAQQIVNQQLGAPYKGNTFYPSYANLNPVSYVARHNYQNVQPANAAPDQTNS